MQIRPIGIGGAFTEEDFHTNFLLEDGTHKLLIDCGSDVRHALRNIKDVNIYDIDSVYVSHLHGDHCGGLEWLGFRTYFDPSAPKVKLHVSEVLADDLWSKVLSGGMASIQGKVTNIDDFFDVNRVKLNKGFEFAGANIKLVQTCHFMNGYYIVPSFGLLIEYNGYKAFITTDTQFAPEQIFDFYEEADVIIQDCETLFTAPSNSPSCDAIKSRVHAHYNDLKTLPDNIKAKMCLCHYGDNVIKNQKVFDEDAKKNGFLGFLRAGDIIDLHHT